MLKIEPSDSQYGFDVEIESEEGSMNQECDPYQVIVTVINFMHGKMENKEQDTE